MTVLVPVSLSFAIHDDGTWKCLSGWSPIILITAATLATADNSADADITEIYSLAGNDLALASGGTRLPITRTYRAIKVVNITLQAVGTATTVKILDKDASLGPLIRAYDSGGTGVTATVDVIIQGY